MKRNENDKEICEFIRETNKIEGIKREPTEGEIAEYKRFVDLESITLDDMTAFVKVYQPDAELRLKSWLNVQVGNHIAPQGGQGILYALDNILNMINNDSAKPYTIHCLYEKLHPWTDCNGRSGRMLWKWQMLKKRGDRAPLGFLHHFYYQSLEASR